jgi:GNAT superfamily N-acetyltransferase
MDASQYSINATLRDGSAVAIRAQRPTDREGMHNTLSRMGDESLQRRFFAPKRYFSESEVAFFLNIDFVQQVALVAVAGDHIVGGCRYILTKPGVAEVAFGVADDWQGRGLGRLLMTHLTDIARDQGLRQFEADVLAGNTPMLGVFQKSGLPSVTHHEADVVHMTLDLT